MDATSWDRVKDLMADALELPASERNAFLETHCPDPALLEEMRDLVQGYDDARSFLEKPAALLLAHDAVEGDALRPGTQIGPYVIAGQVGGGGMGRVYLGNDQRLRRKVALKSLLASPLDPSDEHARILQEARAAARVNHPNVATIHDVIEKGSRAFIVMEYVEGETLSDWLRREPMPLDRALVIARQLASALVAAHANDVVHRDLKPANIQLTREGSPKILDFGIAKSMAALSTLTTTATPEASPSPTLITRRGAGTPQYMSPEQLQGLEAGPASDIFSLGVVLFEMATGRRPFEAMSAAARKMAPLTAAPRADVVDPRIPTAVADAIGKALEIDVNARYQSATEFEARLDRLHRDLDVPGGLALTLKRWALRSLGLITLAPFVFAGMGFITTTAFNTTLQRPAQFASQSLFAYVRLGFQSNVQLILITLFLLGFVAALGALRSLALRLETFKRLHNRVRRGVDEIASQRGLYDPQLLAQLLCTLGFFAIATMYWRYSELMTAFTRFISVTPPELLLPLAPDNFHDQAMYELFVSVLLLSFVAGLFGINQLRRRQSSQLGTGTIAIAIGMVALIVLMYVVPYRILYQNEFEKIDVGGGRCYLIGEGDAEGLIHCPDSPLPRNRVIKLDDPLLHRSGVVESIFTPSERLRPAAPSPSRTP